MKMAHTGTLLVTGLLGASLLISPLAFATEGASEGGRAAVAGQQTKQHTGGKKHKAKAKKTTKKSAKPEGTGTM